MLFSKILSERIIVVQVNTGKNGMSKTLHKLSTYMLFGSKHDEFGGMSGTFASFLSLPGIYT